MKNKIMVNMLVLLAIMMIPTGSMAQTGYNQPMMYNSSSFFITIGYLDGPHFEEFVNWANQFYEEAYGSPEKIGDFKETAAATLGLRVRFTRHFAFEIDFMTASKKISKAFSIVGTTARVEQRLDLTVAAINASVPIMFQFSPRQTIVPFVAAGISIFPLRLDHQVDVFIIRQTKTAIAGNFAVGIDTPLYQKLRATLRADWTYGKASMPVTQTFFNEPDHFDIDLNTMSIQGGILYTFR
ncbi:MAG: hypothetical protein GY839_10415 [candidate division Zixibacteria bacterium]|nr:hypothetical protein [candidate division Zixibacteria bacterium]